MGRPVQFKRDVLSRLVGHEANRPERRCLYRLRPDTTQGFVIRLGLATGHHERILMISRRGRRSVAPHPATGNQSRQFVLSRPRHMSTTLGTTKKRTARRKIDGKSRDVRTSRVPDSGRRLGGRESSGAEPSFRRYRKALPHVLKQNVGTWRGWVVLNRA